MRFASYNIQYGTGKDGRVNLERIAAAVEGADVIALQEVVRRPLDDGGWTDQPAAIAAMFPDYHWVYGAGIDLDCSIRREDGTVENRRRQFGNMLLARTPILSFRNHLLPKHGTVNVLSLQRSAIEGVIETSSGALRVYSIHLGHASNAERLDQCRRLLDILAAPSHEGGVRTGPDQDPALAPPMPHATLLLGDFNFEADSAEYELMCGAVDPIYGRVTRVDGLVDGWIAAGNDPADCLTCDGEDRRLRLDYAFLTPDLAERVRSMHVDQEAQGSDHQPVFIEVDL